MEGDHGGIAPTGLDDAMFPKFPTVVILRVVAEPTSAVLGVLDPATAQSLAQDDVFLGGRGRIGPCGSSYLKPDHAGCWVEGDHGGIAPTGSDYAVVFSIRSLV